MRATGPAGMSIRDYAENNIEVVVNPAIGTKFDSLQEACYFCKFYSWERSFGIRYAKSRLNVLRKECMKEIVCGCVVR